MKIQISLLMALVAVPHLAGQISIVYKVKSLTFREYIWRPAVSKWQGQNYSSF